MEEELAVVRLPANLLARVVSCVGELEEPGDAIRRLGSEWSVLVEIEGRLLSYSYKERESMVSAIEGFYKDPRTSIVCVLKNGIPREFKVDVHVRFR